MIRSFKIWAIRKLGGFPTIEDAIDEIQNKDKPEERRLILTLAVRRLYNTIGPDDILREDAAGNWLVEGKIVSTQYKKQILEEAGILTKMLLWDLLQKDIKYQANRMMFLRSKSDTDIAVGKVWTFSLDAMKTRLNSLAEGKGTFNSKQVSKQG